MHLKMRFSEPITHQDTLRFEPFVLYDRQKLVFSVGDPLLIGTLFPVIYYIPRCDDDTLCYHLPVKKASYIM